MFREVTSDNQQSRVGDSSFDDYIIYQAVGINSTLQTTYTTVTQFPFFRSIVIILLRSKVFELHRLCVTEMVDVVCVSEHLLIADQPNLYVRANFTVADIFYWLATR